MKGSREFFKNLLDNRRAYDEILSLFSDIQNAWNFRSVIQEMRKYIKCKPIDYGLAVVKNRSCVKMSEDPKEKSHGQN